MIKSMVTRTQRCHGSLQQVHNTETYITCPECDQVVSTLPAYDVAGNVVYRLIDSHYLDQPPVTPFKNQTGYNKKRRKRPPYQTYIPVEKTS